MFRFFFEQQNVIDGRVLLFGDDVKHIRDVLRLKTGDKIELCDGDCREFIAELVELDKKQIVAELKLSRDSFAESETNVILFQSIPKGDKMDEIVQKCVELGVKQIVPIISQRTVIKFKTDEEKQKKVERWAKIAKEAAKQSRRGVIPVVRNPIAFEKALTLKEDMLGIVSSEHERFKTLNSIIEEKPENKSTIAVLVGPEGGWEKSEVDLAVDSLWQPFTLGHRILRTETAGLAIVSVVMSLTGEMKWKKRTGPEWHSLP